ncbi:hypothetical protein GCM10018953_45770 [Streptosporangium nondiastaticum]
MPPPWISLRPSAFPPDRERNPVDGIQTRGLRKIAECFNPHTDATCVVQRMDLRHKVEIHQMTGRIIECPIDEMNRPRGRQQAKLRVPPTAE